MIFYLSRPPYRQFLSRSLVGILSLFVSLFVIEIRPSRTSELSVVPPTAIAQTPVTNLEITTYATSVLDIEPHRQEAYEEIKRRIGSVPPIDCYNSNSLNALNPQIRGIVQQYCQQSERIVTGNGLNTQRFNEITRLQQTDPQLEERIRLEILRIQKERSRT